MRRCWVIVVAMMALASCVHQVSSPSLQEGEGALYRFDAEAQTRWASFENPEAQKGKGGMEGNGAKGRPYYLLDTGETVTLLDTEGPGVIHRIWMTVDELFHRPSESRALRIDMYWDGSERPAVSAPLEDFFNQTFGIMRAFDSELFASPEGRSFLSYVQMPFKTGARITLTNESRYRKHRVFYDVNFTRLDAAPQDMLYFHTHWRRENPTTLAEDFVILPRVRGRGRFLGASVGVQANPEYEGWWGEGEVKVFLDGDREFATLVGTGTEDYIGSGWEQAEFASRYSGCLIADGANHIYSFYRYHVVDPIWFHRDIRVTIQQMGGGPKRLVQAMIDKGLPVQPVCHIDSLGEQLNFSEDRYSFSNDLFPADIWTNYYREDDVCATAWFYLDRPENDLPALPSFEERSAPSNYASD